MNNFTIWRRIMKREEDKVKNKQRKKEIFEKEMAAKVDACDKAIRKIYERSKTDKS